MSGAPANIRVFPNDDPRLSRTLRGRLTELLAEKLPAMVYALDWGDHQRRAGEILGIREALAICDEIEKDMRRES